MSLNQLHLSRLILNPRSKEARRDLANPYVTVHPDGIDRKK